MIGRIISMLIFMSLYFALEYYVFTGMKSLFKTPPRVFKWSYWLLVIIPILWMFFGRALVNDQLSFMKGLSNFMGGLFVTLMITKLVFAIFLGVEDLYRIFRYGTESIMAATNKTKDAASFEGRRKFVAQIALGFAALPFFSFLYGITRGKYAYTVHHQIVKSPDLPKAFHGFKVLQISDIHSGSFDSLEAVTRGVEMIQAQKADIILFTGDLVNQDADEIKPFISLFEKLNAPYGKFAVLGNHDYGYYRDRKNNPKAIENMQKLEEHHKSMGFRLLNNESLALDKDGEYIRLAGVENWGKGPFPKEADLDKTFEDSQDNEFTLLMSHDPSHWTAHVLDFPKKIHLTLSGHTHGMQAGIEIPGFKWSPIKYRYPEWAGIYEQDEQQLYVNRGFGFLGFAGRVGILPEITVLELQQA